MEEMLKMVTEDTASPNIDTTPISSLLFFDKFDKETFVLYYDLVIILGSIIYNVFDYDNNALSHIEGGQHGAINLGKMLEQGYNEYVYAKRTKRDAAYGATLIFTTIIEAELKRKFKSIIIHELSADVEFEANNGSFNLLDS